MSANPLYCRLILLAAATALAACVTTNDVAFGRMDTSFPVSASSSYVDAAGRVVSRADYDVAGHELALHLVVEAPILEQTSVRLGLEPDLDAFVRDRGGDAITNLRVETTAIDPGGHGRFAGCLYLSIPTGLLGALVTGLGVISFVSPKTSGESSAGAFVLVGTGLVALSALATFVDLKLARPDSWTISVHGDVVKRKRKQAVPSALTTPTPTCAECVRFEDPMYAVEKPDLR